MSAVPPVLWAVRVVPEFVEVEVGSMGIDAAIRSARLGRGAAHGLVATAAMTGFMLAGRGLGLVDRPSPEAVVSGALEEVDLDTTIRTPARTALVAVLHPFYGAAVGAVFELVMSRRGEPSAIRGGIYGLAVWAFGYLGWLPGFVFSRHRPGKERAVTL